VCDVIFYRLFDFFLRISGSKLGKRVLPVVRDKYYEVHQIIQIYEQGTKLPFLGGAETLFCHVRVLREKKRLRTAGPYPILTSLRRK
jgi:hypothetical protein